VARSTFSRNWLAPLFKRALALGVPHAQAAHRRPLRAAFAGGVSFVAVEPSTPAQASGNDDGGWRAPPAPL